MSYQVLARKWRPRKFAELVGQAHVVRALVHALDSGRMHHAYLFTGTRGVGKTTIARIFAKSLNCERGESADPCGECAICTAVDAGRFVDLLEIDAASNTGVDDVREVIENAQYAPARGRFKVYLVDEVHMLSKPAFNALLKTLEEPPPHVKFLLATTDPQKLPVTVLSRCLKFNLKRLLPDEIAGQMRHILGAEGVSFEDGGILALARAADGSLRDGLSLLDQALAYGGGILREEDVRAMLGSVARGQVLGLLEALASGDGTRLIEECARIASFSPDFAGVLDDLAATLHNIQLRQLIAGYRDEQGAVEAAQLADLAARLVAEDVQLYYQIAITGRRDLALAPDARTGFEMALLRMLAFRPGDMPKAQPLPDVHASPLQPQPREVTPPVPPPPPSPVHRHDSLDWHHLIARAGLHGPLGQLARNAVLRGREGQTLVLAVQPIYLNMAVEPLVGQLADRLSELLEERIKLRFIGDSRPEGDTPAARAEATRSALQSEAEQAIAEDPIAQAIKREFGARVIPQSIWPLE